MCGGPPLSQPSMSSCTLLSPGSFSLSSTVSPAWPHQPTASGIRRHHSRDGSRGLHPHVVDACCVGSGAQQRFRDADVVGQLQRRVALVVPGVDRAARLPAGASSLRESESVRRKRWAAKMGAHIEQQLDDLDGVALARAARILLRREVERGLPRGLPPKPPAISTPGRQRFGGRRTGSAWLTSAPLEISVCTPAASLWLM